MLVSMLIASVFLVSLGVALRNQFKLSWHPNNRDNYFFSQKYIQVSIFFVITCTLLSCSGGGNESNSADLIDTGNRDISDSNDNQGNDTGNGDTGDDTDNPKNDVFTLIVDKFGEGIITSDIAGIDCGTDCTETYPSGTTLVLTPTADTGSEFKSWAGCDSVDSEQCILTMDTNKSVLPTLAYTELTLKPNAKALDSSTMQYLVNQIGTTYYFDPLAVQIIDLKKGDLIATSVGQGFIRRVVDVYTTVDGTLAVDTSAATVEDFIEVGSITYSEKLTHGNLKSSKSMLKGVRLKTAPAVSVNFDVTIDSIIYDQDGNFETKDDQVHIIGSLTTSFQPDFGLSIRFGIKEFKFALITTSTQKLKIITGASIPIIKDLKHPISTLYFTPIPIGILTFFPKVVTYVGIKGSASTAIITEFSMDSVYTAGAHFKKGEGWSPINDYSRNFDFSPPNFSAEVSITGYIRPEFQFPLYDVAGPYINMEGSLSAKAGILLSPSSSRSYWWKIHAGLGASVGVKAKILSWSLADYSVGLDIKSWELYDSITDIVIDSIPPTTPNGILISSKSVKQVNLTWNEAIDDILVAGYNIYRDDTFIKSVPTTNVSDTGIDTSTKYCYSVSAFDHANNESELSAESCVTTPPAMDITPPSAPINLIPTAISTSQIDLSWDQAIDDIGTAGYKILRNGIAVSTVSTTSFSDIDLKPSTNYCYVMTAFDVASNESPSSSQSCTSTLTATNLPPAPSSLTSIAEDSSITLNWDAVYGATSYNIYWNTSGSVTTSSNKIAGATTNYYSHSSLANNTTYFYIVTAIGADGESIPTDIVNATPQSSPNVLNAPTNVAAIASDEQVILSWTENGAGSYSIYWNTTGSVTTIDSSITSITSSYTHIDLTNDVPYYYIVTASNTAGESTPSTQVDATPQAPVSPLNPPSSVVATAGDGQNTVAWANNGATSYTIYWNITGSVSIMDAAINGITTNSYTHTSLTNGTTYYYNVIAINEVGESVLSSEVFATPQSSPTLFDPPSNVAATAGNQQISLEWTSNGADSYTLYWNTTGNVTTSDSAITNITNNSYTHTELTNEVTYYYRVTSINQVGESLPSSQVFATIPSPAIIEIFSGTRNHIALKSDGTVWVWGSTRLGDGTTNRSQIPVQVCAPGETAPCTNFLSDVVIVSSKHFTTIALKKDGSVWVWGDNLGDGTLNSSTTPVQLCAPGEIAPCESFISNVIRVSTNGSSLALKSDGTVWAWGSQLGLPLGETSIELTPYQICASDEIEPCSNYFQ